MTPTRRSLFLGAVPWGLWAALVWSGALTACSSSGEVGCRTAADCASGACHSDGTCEPVKVDAGPGHTLATLGSSSGSTGLVTSSTGSSSGSTGHSTSTSTTGAASTSSSSGTHGSTSGSTGATGSTGSSACATSTSGGAGTTGGTCHPNHDGTITRAEEGFAAGLRATYRIATSTPIDTAGTPSACGTVWDLTGALSNDESVLVTTDPVTGQWWSADFPTATYASKLSTSSDLLGVFQATNDALLLLGVVSPTSGSSSTEVTYAPAVVVLQFPITASSTWSTDSTVSGTYNGFSVYYYESYTSAADGVGTMKTPFADFQVQRIHTDLTKTVGFLVTTTRTFLFVAECFGTVATMVSTDNETEDEFTTASEVRRLSP